ncbi:MAG: BolA family transcriptional regulator [Robiginitomaculum sp.]|nr:BolA family transcriptional regulator [Robiginitomaculum sp.]
MGLIAASIKEKLEKAFNPTQLDVIDESHKHAGHAGAEAHAAKYGQKPGSGESHFHVIIASETLTPMNRLARHRAVMDVLADLMIERVHALRLEVVVG